MLFQPVNVVPSSFSGTESQTIDTTEALSVSWQVNGNSPMLAYQIDFYQNNASSLLLYSTGKVNLASPFYGVNNLGEPQYFTATAISSATLINSGIYNGYSNGYKYIITQWWSSTEYIAQTSANVFLTRSAPSYAIDAFPNPITATQYTFTATYTQAQGDTLNWVRWYIAQGSDTDNLLYDSGYIYGTAQLSVSYDGFFSGESYMIKSDIQTENGVDATTGWQSFDVSYTTETYSGYLTAAQSSNHSGVLLTISGASSIPGTTSGVVNVGTSSAILAINSSVSWDSVSGQDMAFAPPNAIAWRGTVWTHDSTPIQITYPSSNLSVRIWDETSLLTTTHIDLLQNGNLVSRTTWDGSAPNTTWTIIINPDHFYVATSGGIIITKDYSVDIYNGSISSAKINGSQTCYYFEINNVAFTASEITSRIDASNTNKPTWGSDTNLLATFSSNTNGGNLAFTGYSIYREEVGTNTLTHVADIDISVTALIDFGAKSQSSYLYYAYSTDAGAVLTTPLVSNQITPLFWSPTIVSCNLDTSGTEIVGAEKRFSANVETAEMSNNNEPSILENFTQYPLRQPKNANYKTGSLTAMLGDANCNTNTYSDTDADFDALLALSTTTDDLFLKTRKGAIYKIATSGAIKGSIGDTYAVQPYTVTVPWVEVGSASGVSLVALQGGALWNTDNIILTTTYVDLDTGNLYWSIPDDYTDGSVLSLDSLGNLLQSSTEIFNPAVLSINSIGNLYATT